MGETDEDTHPVWDEPALIKAFAWHLYRRNATTTTENKIAKAPELFGYVIVHHEDGSYTLRGMMPKEGKA